VAKRQSATSVSDLEQNFSWRSDGQWPGLVSRLPDSSISVARLPVWLPKEWPIALLPRTTPMHLNEGYPMQLTQEFHLALPDGAALPKLPAPQQGTSVPLTWQISWKKNADGGIGATVKITLQKADLSLDEARQFQACCQNLFAALQEGLSFQSP
jgi:hypothetical protein